MNQTMRVGIAGLGTVGAGVVKILTQSASDIAGRCGRRIEIIAISVRNPSKDRGIPMPGRFVADPVALADAADIDVVVELMGGEGDPAHALVRRALERGKSVVTANKALLSRHGLELAAIAERSSVSLNFEGAVAGGIPIIKAIREALTGNRVERIYGILNGTCNFILSEMTKSGRTLEDVLTEAQLLGYAEADPSFDVGGIDAAHKLSLLSALAFGIKPDFAAIHIEGITGIGAEDIGYAEELGYCIKLLGIGQRTARGIELRVHPAMVDTASAIARIDGATNAVVVEGQPVGTLAFQGPGAGSGATASAVVADIADIARGNRNLPFIVPVVQLQGRASASFAEHVGRFYLRLKVEDRAGVLAAIAAALAQHEVSIESLLQHARAPGAAVTIVLTTHECREGVMQSALLDITKIDSVRAQPTLIRIETLS